MNDKKQIEIKKLVNIITKTYPNKYNIEYPAKAIRLANEIYDKLIPKDSIVLTRKELEKMVNAKMKCINDTAVITRKETAIDFAEKVKTKIKELRRKYHEDYINGLGDEEYNGLTENNVDEILKEMEIELCLVIGGKKKLF